MIEAPTSNHGKHLWSSTISNIAYVCFGFALVWNFPEYAEPWTLALAVAGQIILGVLSGVYHITTDYLWQKMDVLAIVWLACIGLAYNASMYFVGGDEWMALLAVVACIAAFPYRDKFMHWHIALLLMANIVLVYYRGGYALAALGFFAVAFAANIFANRFKQYHLWYDLLHGFPWHGMSATGIYLCFL